MKPLLLICVSMFLLAGCGQKGPLYLPSTNQGANHVTPVHNPSSNETTNE